MAWNKELIQSLLPPRPDSACSDAVWPVPPKGPVDLMLLGEAPGRQEVEQGRPFVGPAGTLLRSMIEDHVRLPGGETPNCYYTNASWYRPKPQGSTDRRPLPTVVAAERPRLHVEIALVNPKAIVALGRTAGEALAPDRRWYRGRSFYVTILGRQIPIWLTWHPAYCFREPDAYLDIVADLQRAAENRVASVPLTYVIKEPPRLDPKVPRIYVDVETAGLPVHMSPVLMVAVTQEQGAVWIWTPEQPVRPWNRAIAAWKRAARDATGGALIIGHNVFGDQLACHRVGLTEITFTDDTLIRHYSVYMGKTSRALKSLGPAVADLETLCDTVNLDDPRSNPDSVLSSYCATDAAVTRGLWHALTLRDEWRDDAGLYAQMLRELHRLFVAGGERGICVDTFQLACYDKQLSQQIDEIRSAFPGDLDLDSPKQLLVWLTGQGYKLKDTSSASLTALPQDDTISRLVEYRKASKLLHAFVRPLAGLLEDGVLHPQHFLAGTRSGRTVSMEPNVQQIPPDMKDLFYARENHKFIGWDFAQHELRGLAYLSQDERLIGLFQAGTDPYQEVANVAGISRQAAKRAVLGRAYGASDRVLWETGVFESREQLAKALRVIDALFPGLLKWREQVWETVKKTGVLQTPFGRKRYFPFLPTNMRTHILKSAVNFLPQSLCNDIALMSILEARKRTKLDIVPLLFVHDFVMFEIPTECLEDVRSALAEWAENAWPNPYVRFKADIKIGETWGGLSHEGESDSDSDSDSDAGVSDSGEIGEPV